MEWKDYKELLQTDGEWDEQKIENEITDLLFVVNQVSEVYMHITGNQLSKLMYFADVIKAFHDDAVNAASSGISRDAVEGLFNDLKQWADDPDIDLQMVLTGVKGRLKGWLRFHTFAASLDNRIIEVGPAVNIEKLKVRNAIDVWPFVGKEIQPAEEGTEWKLVRMKKEVE